MTKEEKAAIKKETIVKTLRAAIKVDQAKDYGFLFCANSLKHFAHHRFLKNVG